MYACAYANMYACVYACMVFVCMYMQELVDYNLPQPHQHVDGPVPASVPAPPKFTTASPPPSKKRQAKATPKAPGKRRRKASLSPVPSPSSPPIWTDEDKKILRTLKSDEIPFFLEGHRRQVG